MKGSLVILAFFAAGVAIGNFCQIPEIFIDGEASKYALYALLFFVGFTIGNDTSIIDKFKHINPRVALLPLVTVIGSLAASLLISFVMPNRSAADCMAVGSGLAYYSLSSIMITGYKGAELGTIALLANVIRELTTLLITPLLAKWFGPLAPISSGGAAAMDTTLPIILRYSGQEYAVVSIYHGFMATLLVPFLVTFFCSL